MQSYQDIPDTTTLTASRSLLLSNILTAISQSSGTAFPTTNLVLGMPCYRTDLNKTYVLTNLTGPVWTLEQDNARTVAYLDDTVAAATKLATARTISISGDMTGSVSFDGTANVAITGALANSGVAAGTYAAATITVDAKGRVTSASATSSLVNTFNSRTGAVTLSSADVTGALGFTPMNSSNTAFSNMSITSTSPTINLVDSNWGTRYLYHDNGLAGFLNSSANWAEYSDNSGNVWTAAYGWLHSYFFSTISHSDSVVNCTNCGNIAPSQCGPLYYTSSLSDGGSNIVFNRQWARQYTQCNCACDCSCVPAGTQVTMADGTVKAIETITVGESVYSDDTSDEVVGLWTPVLGKRSLWSINGELQITGDHLIETIDGWACVEPELFSHREVHGVAPDVEYSRLSIGNQIKTVEGFVEVTSLERVEAPESLQLYSLIVSGSARYYANGICVDGILTPVTSSTKQTEEVTA